MEPKRSRLFYKARERIIDELAIRLTCDAISEDASDDSPKIPETWMQEAEARVRSLFDELQQESLREDELTDQYRAGPTTKAKERF